METQFELNASYPGFYVLDASFLNRLASLLVTNSMESWTITIKFVDDAAIIIDDIEQINEISIGNSRTIKNIDVFARSYNKNKIKTVLIFIGDEIWKLRALIIGARDAVMIFDHKLKESFYSIGEQTFFGYAG